MIVLNKEVLTHKIEVGDLVQDALTGDYSIVGFKNWVGKTKKGYFLFEFKYNDISGIYDRIEEMVQENALQLVAKKSDLTIVHGEISCLNIKKGE